MVSEKVGRVEGLTPHFRMIARRRGMCDQLVVEVEAAGGLDEKQRQDLARRLAEMITQAKAEIALAVERREIAPIVVQVLPPETIPRNPRTGKIKQVVDQRE